MQWSGNSEVVHIPFIDLPHHQKGKRRKFSSYSEHLLHIFLFTIFFLFFPLAYQCLFEKHYAVIGQLCFTIESFWFPNVTPPEALLGIAGESKRKLWAPLTYLYVYHCLSLHSFTNVCSRNITQSSGSSDLGVARVLLHHRKTGFPL